MSKPANLVYGVEEVPPHLVTFVSAVQHVGVIAIFMVYPLIIARQAGVPADQIARIRWRRRSRTARLDCGCISAIDYCHDRRYRDFEMQRCRIILAMPALPRKALLWRWMQTKSSG